MAVLGREQLYPHEIEAMLAADYVRQIYFAREHAKNRGEWARDNRAEAGFLTQIELALEDYG